jgi:hypothetical protein
MLAPPMMPIAEPVLPGLVRMRALSSNLLLCNLLALGPLPALPVRGGNAPLIKKVALGAQIVLVHVEHMCCCAWCTRALLEQLSGVFRLYRGAGLELLSRVIQLHNYYCIAIGGKLLSVLMLKEGPLGGPLSVGKRDGLALGLKAPSWAPYIGLLNS